MSVSREDIEKVAHLARIAVNEENIAATTDSINRVLSLVDQLQAADTRGIEPLAHPLDVAQRLRTDEVSETDMREAFQAIAPATEEGLFLVPKVIE